MEIIEESSRPSVGFPLGLALLLILLFSMCGFFTCCIHWNKLRSLFGLPTDYDDHHDDPEDNSFYPQKPPPPQQEAKEKKAESLTVVMPGDQIPKFIAISCPPQSHDHLLVQNLPSFSSFPFHHS